MTSIATRPQSVARRPRWQQSYITGLIVTDTIVVAVAITLAQYVRFGSSPGIDYEAMKSLTGFSAIFVLLWASALAIFRSRSHRVVGSGIEEYRRVVNASFWTFGVIAIVTLLLRLEVARGYLAVAFPVGTLGLLLARRLWRVRLSRARTLGHCTSAVLAIGDTKAVSWMAGELTRNPADGYRIVGIGIPGYGEPCGDVLVVNGQEIPILGDEVRALGAIGECGADTVVVTDTEHFGVAGLRALTWQLESMDVDLVVSPGVMDIAEARLAMRPVSNFPLIHVEKPQYHGAARFAKRAFDFCFALAALIAMSPLLLVAAFAIKLTSRGPVFYCAERIGLDGKPFTMLKFRTMVEDADTRLHEVMALNEVEGGVLFKVRDDPRVTPVGRWLRRLSIDELPQFINVLKQDMSVVGPRPPLPSEVLTYDGEVRRRLLVKPGITGLWQVSGRSDLSWSESVRLDLSYVENWSMIGDLLIILKTVGVVFARQGAY